MRELEEVIDRWGANPDEWFVVAVHHDEARIYLSKSPGGLHEDSCGPNDLERPDDPSRGLTLRVGDLVRRRV